MKNRFWPIIASVAVLAGLFALFNAGGQDAGPAAKSAAPEPPPRPAVPAIALPRADGGTFSTAAYKGNAPVVISFFATWCGPCREELPHLIALYHKYHAAGLQIAYITSEDAEIARRFARQESVPFPILIDADSVVANQFGADSIPTTYVLDKKGRAADSCQGYSEERLAQIETLLGQLLKE